MKYYTNEEILSGKLDTNDTVISTHVARNMKNMKLSLNDNERQVYKILMENDYINDYYADEIAKFWKRPNLNNQYVKENLNSYDEIFYKEELIGSKIENIIFVFNTLKNENGVSFIERYIDSKNNLSFKSLKTNTLIVTLFDINGHNGSNFMPTDNFPNYGKKIAKFISWKLNENFLNETNAILLGTEKEATAVMKYSSETGVKFVGIDPNFKNYTKKDVKNASGTLFFHEGKMEKQIVALQGISSIKLSQIPLVYGRTLDKRFVESNEVFVNEINVILNTKNQIDPNKVQINKLLSGLRFGELKEFYQKLIKEDEKYVVEYFAFLFRISDLDQVREDFKNYDLADYLDKMVSTNAGAANALLNMYDFKQNDFAFNLDFEQQFYDLIQCDVEKALRFVEKNAKYFTDVKYSKNMPILFIYLINKLSKSTEKHNMLHTAVFRNISTARCYNSIQKKYMVTSIIDYCENYNPEYLLYTEGYNQLQILNYLLTGLNLSMYYEGIRTYTKKLYSLNKITLDSTFEFPNYEKKASSKKAKGKEPRIALCISGVTRLNVRKTLLEYKKMFIDIIDNVDVYIFSWDEYAMYPGLACAVHPTLKWAYRFFPDVIPDIPQEIMLTGNFKKKLPNTLAVFDKEIKLKNDESYYKEIFPNAKVIIGNEKEFEEEYKNKEGFIRREKLNQAKQYFGMHTCFGMVDPDTDFIIRARPDYTPVQKLTFDSFKKLNHDEIAVTRAAANGMSDFYFFGSYKNMMKIVNIWDLALHEQDLSPLLHDGKKYPHDSHRLQDVWFTYTGLIPNTELSGRVKPFVDGVVAPEYREALKKDLKNLTPQDQAKYQKFFDKHFAHRIYKEEK